jgi:L-2,4-diaminobutyrate decarboxylase
MVHGCTAVSDVVPPSGTVGGDGLPLEAFDPRLFRQAAETAIGILEDHLGDTSIRGLELADPAVLERTARALMTTEHERIAPLDSSKLAAIIDLYIRTGIQVHSPGAMGRQFSGAVPLAALIDLVSSVVNQPSSFYEASQLPNVAERIMTEQLGRFIGWDPDRMAMVTTSGGSLANLTALLAARNDRFPQSWSDGIAGLASHVRPAIAVGQDAHYSVTRAAGILGIGDAQIVRLPLNHRRQICAAQAGPALDAARRRGLDVFCLVASAGTTSVGAFDPLDELADLARTHDLWLHVDGAHGASLLVSDRLRHKLRGIERADSLAWDAHKMMFVPPACTLLFYRDGDKSYRAFRQEASYVFDRAPSIYTELDSAEQTLECTKRPLMMTLWVLWSMYGRALFAHKIEYLCRLTEQAHLLVQAEPDFETLHRPEANILCFRYRPGSIEPGSVSELQVAIRDQLRRQGTFFISKVDIDDVAALRVVMTNHRTTLDHFRMLLEEIRRSGQALMEGTPST